eukprot:2742608-Pyramimonas_sp.AAC.1
MYGEVTADRYGEPTYYGSKANSNAIDHIFVPMVVLEQIISGRALWSEMSGPSRTSVEQRISSSPARGGGVLGKHYSWRTRFG